MTRSAFPAILVDGSEGDREIVEMSLGAGVVRLTWRVSYDCCRYRDCGRSTWFECMGC